MNVFLTAFESMAVLFVVGFIGIWALIRKILPENSTRVLSILAIEIALPCHIFYTIITKFNPVGNPGWWKLPLMWAAFTAGAGLLTFCSVPAFSKANRRECAMALFYQNAVFVPLILISQLFGAESPHIVNLFLFTMFFPAFFFTTHRLFLPAARSRRFRLSRIIPPALIATALGLGIRLAAPVAVLPSFLLAGIQMIGLMSTPALLLLLGGSIYLDFRERGPFAWRDVLVFVGIKNIIFPLAALGILFFLKLPAELSFLLIIQSAAPPITALPVVAEKAGADKKILNQIMLGSFIATPLTLPTALYLHSLFAAGSAT